LQSCAGRPPSQFLGCYHGLQAVLVGVSSFYFPGRKERLPFPYFLFPRHASETSGLSFCLSDAVVWDGRLPRALDRILSLFVLLLPSARLCDCTARLTLHLFPLFGIQGLHVLLFCSDHRTAPVSALSPSSFFFFDTFFMT